jgi:hypothetical protein
MPVTPLNKNRVVRDAWIRSLAVSGRTLTGRISTDLRREMYGLRLTRPFGFAWGHPGLAAVLPGLAMLELTFVESPGTLPNSMTSRNWLPRRA